MHSIDATDSQLLRALIDDPRGTFVALAGTLQLSRNTVQARMTRLEASGVFLSFDRRINPVALGYPLTAFIEVHVQQKRLAQIVADLAGIPEIVQAHGMSGTTDLLVQVSARMPTISFASMARFSPSMASTARPPRWRWAN